MAISKINFNSRELVTTPAFCAEPTSDQENFTIASSVEIVFGTERFDNNGDFASNTFTAPVTGRYLLNTAIRFHAIDSAASYIYIYITTSNATYQNIHSSNRYSGDLSYHSLPLSVVADMDASDTAKVYVYVSSDSAAQVDIDNGGSHFSGCLLA